jgi:sulfate-transporting ATPase
MQEFIRYALLGLGVGSLYALSSQGLLIVYRGSGVLNFAHGAIGMVGAFIWWDLSYRHGYSFGTAMVIGVLCSAAVGALVQLLVMRPLRRAAPLVRLVATLGVLIVLQSIATLRYGTDTQIIKSTLPTSQVTIIGDATVSADRLILLGIAAVLTVALWALYRYSTFGIGTTAVAGNQRAAAALGWSPNLIATANWALGSALAGVAAILIAPIVQLQVGTMTTLTLASMSAALVAQFRSFPVAFLAGIGIGAAQTVLARYVNTPGLADSLPFAVIVAVLIISGTSLPVRGYFLQRLPSVGTGRVQLRYVLPAVLAAVLVIALVSAPWLDAIAITLSAALVLLSIVVLTGYTGQISLAQFALAGVGAYFAGRLVAAQGWEFAPAAVVGMLAAIPVGALFALPAVKTRGITLAVVTLGLGTTLELMVFNNPDLTGGYSGTNIGDAHLLGLDVDSAAHPARWAFVCLGVFLVAALAVANLRRGRTGRRLLAVRTNERAAAALGIGVPATKLYAFAISAGIAALGGILIAFKSSSIVYTSFAGIESITYVGYAVIGGLGYVVGPLLGAGLVPGAIASAFSNEVLESITRYIPLIGGATVILMVLANQDGLARSQIDQIQAIGRWFGSRRPSRPEKQAKARAKSATKVPPVSVGRDLQRVGPMTLKVTDLTVRYGAMTAVDKLSLTIEPGKIVGLIGPNGAGKTSAIDAMTGFARAEGSLELDGKRIDRYSAARRSRTGISRSFQSLELFEDLTVIENLRTATDRRDWWTGIADIFYPHNPELPSSVVAAIDAFGLRELVDKPVEDLPYGQRRLLAIARAVATEPSILLLDEPAAGLGSTESAELASLVRRLPDERGMGVLLVEHDMSFVMSVCDEIVVLDFGHQIAAGAPQLVRNDPKVIAAYLGETEEELRDEHLVIQGGGQ